MSPPRIRHLAAILVALALLACQAGAAADPPLDHGPRQALSGPTRVIDGDTFDLYGRDGRVRIRIYGIDTPERGERGWRAATEGLRALLAAGPVACAVRPGEVTFGRLVATCDAGGQDVALAQLRAGLAAPWCSYLRGDPLEAGYLAAAAIATATIGAPPAKPRHHCPPAR